jgi:hypothetical protein
MVGLGCGEDRNRLRMEDISSGDGDMSSGDGDGEEVMGMM